MEFRVTVCIQFFIGKINKRSKSLKKILLIDEGQILLPFTKNDYYVFATEFKAALSSNA